MISPLIPCPACQLIEHEVLIVQKYSSENLFELQVLYSMHNELCTVLENNAAMYSRLKYLCLLMHRPCHSETDDAEFNLIDLADLHVLDFGKSCLHFAEFSLCYTVSIVRWSTKRKNAFLNVNVQCDRNVLPPR